MVVEENRVSSNSTGSSLRMSSDSTGSSNSRINEMESGKLPSHAENVQSDGTGTGDRNLGSCEFPSSEEIMSKANESCKQEPDSLEANNSVSILSNDENCASGLMPQTDHDRSLDKCVSGDSGSKSDLKADGAIIEAAALSCRAEIHSSSVNKHTQSNSSSQITPLASGSCIAIDVIVIDKNKGVGDTDENFEGVIDTEITSDSEAETDTDSQTKIDPYELELNNECYEVISKYIPEGCWNTPLKCFSYKTITDISYRLDVIDDAPGETWSKDYIGLCERINLDHAFTKYLVKSYIKLKTEEVLSKWEVLPTGSGPKPTVGNFCKIVNVDLQRPDIIDDLHENIVKDAQKWEKSKSEANTDQPEKEDNSWQLTRHDVATGKKTFYTACLCYADEDEGMATLITNFFQSVWKDTRFFRPQFDLKMGKYVCDTTAKVIEDRCNGKVIFILSDYFYASEVCQFAVNFAHQVDAAAEQGNLIPFYLTNNYDRAPKVLKGIAGVRWGRKQFRYNSWGQLTESLISKKDHSNKTEVSKIQERIKVELNSSESSWLCDPPYDEGTPAPGPALPLNEPPEESTNSSSRFDPDGDENSPIVSSAQDGNSRRTPWYTRLRNRLRAVLQRSNTRGRSRSVRREELNRAFEEESGPSAAIV